MLLFVPLYWLFSTGKVLLVLQTLALGLAALPAFLVAREKLRSEVLAAAIAVAYLVNSYIGYTNLESFHPDVFAVPLVFLAFWFLLRRRWVGFFVSIVLMLLVKEDVPLLVIGLGIWVAIRYHRRFGLLTAVWALSGCSSATASCCRSSTGAEDLPTYIARHGREDPVRGCGRIPEDSRDQAVEGRRTSLRSPSPLVLPSGVRTRWPSSRSSPRSRWSCCPGPLLANGLSTFPYQYQIEYHYGTLVVPSMFVAAIFGIARFRGRVSGRRWWACCSPPPCVSAWLWGPLPHTRHAVAWAPPRTAYTRAVDAAIKLIPADAVVSADSTTAMHLDRRREIYEFPNPWYQRNWGAGDATGQSLPDRAARVDVHPGAP